MKPKIYIAGPMTGYENNNYEKFFEKDKQLTALGWDVINPAHLDIKANIVHDSPYSYEEAAGRDVKAIQTCTAIYMMADWERSKGACWERALAKHWGILRYYEIPRADHLVRQIAKQNTL